MRRSFFLIEKLAVNYVDIWKPATTLTKAQKFHSGITSWYRYQLRLPRFPKGRREKLQKGGAGASLVSTDHLRDNEIVTPLGCSIKNPYESSHLKIHHFLAPFIHKVKLLFTIRACQETAIQAKQTPPSTYVLMLYICDICDCQLSKSCTHIQAVSQMNFFIRGCVAESYLGLY